VKLSDHTARVWRALVFTSCLLGCSLDDRTLNLRADPAAAGHDDGGGAAPSGGRASSAEGGTGGANDTGLIDGCADLDTDGVADCTVTLVRTPSFAMDVSHWQASEGAVLTWDSKNALADLPSGSARLSSRMARPSARQCVELAGENLVVAWANVFVEQTQPAASEVSAQLEVSFYETAGCSGDSERFFETPLSSGPGEWGVVQAGSISAPTTRSVAIALVANKPGEVSEAVVYFDNVMLKAKQP
jgi:hypothetical protein